MRRALSALLLAAAFALASWIGWEMVPAVGGLWGILAGPPASPRPGEVPGRPGRPGRPLFAGLAALLGWAAWLGYDWWAGAGGLGRLGGRLAGLVGAPSAVVIGVTLAFPALLAATAALVGGGLRAALPRRPAPGAAG